MNHKVRLPYTAKLSWEKTFAVVHKTHYSLENFHGASGPCHYVLYTVNDSRGKLSRLAKKNVKTAKVFPLKSFAVYSMFVLVALHSYVSLHPRTKEISKQSGV